MNKPKIFIAGLSWARGEWVGPNVVHDGTEQYFIDAGYTVINVAKPRVTHKKIHDLLDAGLLENYQPGDQIFWIQADPLLDIIVPELIDLGLLKERRNRPLPTFSNRIKLASGVKNLIQQQQEQIYNELNQLAVKYSTQIHCIGGTYNINPNIVSKFSNLNLLVQSWIHLLVGHLKEYPQVNNADFGVCHTWDIDCVDLSIFDLDLVEQVKSEVAELTGNIRVMDELIFHPDGLHPNREGHKILYDYLVKNLNL